MIRVYRAKRIGTGTYEDPYRSILDNFANAAVGGHFYEVVELTEKVSVCLLTAPKAVHDAIVAYEVANPSSVNYLSGLHADMAGLRTQYSQLWADLPLAFRTKAESLLEIDGLADFTGTIKQVLGRLLKKYEQSKIIAKVNSVSFGGEVF